MFITIGLFEGVATFKSESLTSNNQAVFITTVSATDGSVKFTMNAGDPSHIDQIAKCVDAWAQKSEQHIRFVYSVNSVVANADPCSNCVHFFLSFSHWLSNVSRAVTFPATSGGTLRGL